MKLLIFLFYAAITVEANLPVVLWHGMGDNCCHSFSMGAFEKMIRHHVPGVDYIRSLMIGASPTADTENGFVMPVDEQLELACAMIKNDTRLADGYNAIGFSQGAQFLRGVAQKRPGMVNLISFGGQHQGIYGLPKCPGSATICEWVRELLGWGAYTYFVQSRLVQAQYWHDPNQEETYTKYSQFIARINCEGGICPAAYAENLKLLEKFVMVKFNQDSMVVPPESSHFGYYQPGQDQDVVDMHQLPVYTDNRIGLREMDEQGKLVMLSTDGDHLQITEDFFAEQIVPYL